VLTAVNTLVKSASVQCWENQKKESRVKKLCQQGQRDEFLSFVATHLCGGGVPIVHHGPQDHVSCTVQSWAGSQHGRGHGRGGGVNGVDRRTSAQQQHGDEDRANGHGQILCFWFWRFDLLSFGICDLNNAGVSSLCCWRVSGFCVLLSYRCEYLAPLLDVKLTTPPCHGWMVQWLDRSFLRLWSYSSESFRHPGHCGRRS
jgi:hypothetical protein